MLQGKIRPGPYTISVMNSSFITKVPAYYLFVSELPMTASQKLQRGEIKALAGRLVEEGRCIDLRERKRKRKNATLQ